MTTDTTPTLSPAVDLDSLTPGQARRLVLLDVLAQIRSGRLVPAYGTYVSTRSPRGDYDGDSALADAAAGDDLRTVLAGVRCDVCAKGALFLAHVDCFDRLPVTQALRDGADSLSEMASDDLAGLLPYFPPRTLQLAEAFFEGWAYASDDRPDMDDVEVKDANDISLADRIDAFDARFRDPAGEPDDPAGRLTALVEHMLAHDGLLVPEALVPDDAVPAARGD